MVGHYLLTLEPDAESRVLTQQMSPGPFQIGGACLLGIAEDWQNGFHGRRYLVSWMNYDAEGRLAIGGRHPLSDFNVGFRYDALCLRFGTERVNAAIRNRILSNQARRALAGVRELVAT